MAANNLKIEISLKSILFTIAVLLGLYFLYQISEIILFFFIGLLLMAALNPLVERLQSLKIGRGLSIGIVYIFLVALLAISITAIFPPLISQAIILISQIPIPPELSNNIKNINLSLQDIQVIANQLNSIPKLFNVVGTAFSGVVVFVSLLVLSFYLLLERANLSKTIRSYYKAESQAKKAEAFIIGVETQIGSWVRAEFILMLAVGIMTFIGLTFLQMPYALSLAVFAGILEILPTIGPVLSAIPAVIIAYFMGSPALALGVAVLYLAVQQIENNLIVPLVMRRAVGLSPVITIIILLIGFKLSGVAGAALAIPIFLVVKVVATEIYNRRNRLD